MSIVTLRRAGVGTGALVAAHGLAAEYQWTFSFAQSFILGVNGVLLGSLLYQSRLVPRWLPVLGFIGAVLLVASWVATLMGLIEAVSPIAGVAALPIAVWEFSLGVYRTFWASKPPDYCSHVKEPLPPSNCDGGSGFLYTYDGTVIELGPRRAYRSSAICRLTRPRQRFAP